MVTPDKQVLIVGGTSKAFCKRTNETRVRLSRAISLSHLNMSDFAFAATRESVLAVFW